MITNLSELDKNPSRPNVLKAGMVFKLPDCGGYVIIVSYASKSRNVNSGFIGLCYTNGHIITDSIYTGIWNNQDIPLNWQCVGTLKDGLIPVK